jgi:hypothetical protein
MRAQRKTNRTNVYVKRKTLATHTWAKELYRREDKKKKTEQIVHCLCQCATEKNRRKKVKKKRKDNNALPIKKWTIQHYCYVRNRYVHEECE